MVVAVAGQSATAAAPELRAGWTRPVGRPLARLPRALCRGPLPDDPPVGRSACWTAAAGRRFELARQSASDHLPGRAEAAKETAVKKAIVVYRSHTGVTRRYGEAIGAWLAAHGVSSQVLSVGEADPATVTAADYLFLGCWTSGLFVILQHPDEPWLAFVRDMPDLPARKPKRPRVALFTTYKLATGSQFARMRATLAGKTPTPELELKSRTGRLSAKDEQALQRLLA
jgi:flavodoxin